MMLITHTLTAGHFLLESVSMPGSLRDATPTKESQKREGELPVKSGGGA